MFTASELGDSGNGGPATGVAALSLAQALSADTGPGTVRRWRAAIERRCQAIDLAPDLAEDIGSRAWCRGLATMAGLAVIALAFWPDFTEVSAATATSVDGATRDEFRSQMILPLALGGDSGRRMGATARVAPLASVPERTTIRLTATLAQGDSFVRTLERAGVSGADAARAAALVAGAVPVGEIAPGTRIDLTLGRRAAPGTPRQLDRLSLRARFDLALALSRDGSGLTLQRRSIEVSDAPLRIRGAVGASLYRSARAAGAPIKAIQQYLQTIDANVGLDNDIAPSDQFDLIVGYRRAASGETEVGELIYAGLERGGKPRAQLLRWGKGGQFFEASGLGRERVGTFAPVNGRLTSGFGMRRHPILGYTRMHGGVDFGAAWGSPVYAVSDAVVSYAGWKGGNGNFVRLEHGGGLASGYSHLSRLAVAPGSRVNAGQVVGYVGSTGLSTGPHLHYEVYVNGQRVNPLGVRFTVRSGVDGKELAAFKARLAQLQKIDPGAALR